VLPVLVDPVDSVDEKDDDASMAGAAATAMLLDPNAIVMMAAAVRKIVLTPCRNLVSRFDGR
jgi:hypothetical protein